ncbi:MAG: hypothetical protein MUQ00_16215, partial [Candidatus Aminicenantes bacterium]|nr:hypothetical protein [Candidatus Aminicenantes bacterium]
MTIGGIDSSRIVVPGSGAGQNQHTVEPGETLAGIASKHGVSGEEPRPVMMGKNRLRIRGAAFLLLGTTLGIGTPVGFATRVGFLSGSQAADLRGMPKLASWTSIGPKGGTVVGFAVDPSNSTTVYAAAGYGGVFRSTDAGGTWQAMNAGLSSQDVRAVAVDPVTSATLYAATYPGGVFKSVNGGSSWKPMNKGLGSDEVSCVA